MQIRTEDIRAIVTAVEWIVEGTLSEVRIHRDGECVFAARLNGDALQIDPDVMPAELARRLLNETDLLGGSSGSDETSGSRSTGATHDRAEPSRQAKAKARV